MTTPSMARAWLTGLLIDRAVKRSGDPSLIPKARTGSTHTQQEVRQASPVGSLDGVDGRWVKG